MGRVRNLLLYFVRKNIYGYEVTPTPVYETINPTPTLTPTPISTPTPVDENVYGYEVTPVDENVYGYEVTPYGKIIPIK